MSAAHALAHGGGGLDQTPVAIGGGVASSLGWTGTARLGRASIQFLGSVFLARMLAPEDFGLLGMILMFSGFAALFGELGFSGALVQREQLEERHCTSVFWVNCAAGVALTLLFVAAAPLFARFFEEPRLTPLARLLASTFAINGLGIVHTGLLSRRMRFRALGTIDVLSAAAGSGTAVLLAYLGFGVESLVWLHLAAAATQVSLSWTMSGWRPGWSFDRRAVGDLLPFSANMLGFSSLNYWMRNADNLLIGRVLGPYALGIYARAYGLMLLPIQQVSSVAGKVMFPALARIQTDHAAVKEAYLRAIRWIALVTFPMMLGLLVVADHFVLAVYGKNWMDVVPVLRILCLVGLGQSIGSTVGWLYQSQGRTDLMFRWSIFSGVVTLAAFAIGIRWGVMGVAVAYALCSVALTYHGLAIPGRLVGLRFREIMAALARTLAAALGMTAVLLLLRLLPVAERAALALGVDLVVGASIYLVLARMLRLEASSELAGWWSERRAVAKGRPVGPTNAG